MPFELKLSIRYLLSTKLQSSLLVLGVAVGVVVFTFIAALINGLGVRLTDDVVGNIAHITLEAPERMPTAFMASPSGRALMATQPGSDTRAEIRTYRQALMMASKLEGVIAAVPEVVGNVTPPRTASSSLADDLRRVRSGGAHEQGQQESRAAAIGSAVEAMEGT